MRPIRKSPIICGLVFVFTLFFIFSFYSLLYPNLSYGASLIVNIDSPNFRKISMAVVESSGSEGLSSTAKQVSSEISRLMNFSRLFNVMSSSGYKDLQASLNSKKTLSFIESPSNASLSSIRLDTWKNIGVESLILSRVVPSKQGKFTLYLVCIDINKRAVVVSKKYTNLQVSGIRNASRRFCDHVLETYTGKPGIFASKIVFVGKEKSAADNKQIYICDFDGSNVQRISIDKSAIHLSPSWSSDGRYISYTSYSQKTPDIYIYDTKLKTTKRLIASPGLDSGSNWSANDKIIAYTTSQGNKADIFISDLKGNRRPFIKGSGLDVDPKFSPDGNKFAFVSGRYGAPHIFVADIAWKSDTNPVVTGEKRITFAGWYNATPAWSPSSDKLIFAGFDKDINRFDLFMVNPDGRNLERLTINSGDNENPSWSPNSGLIVFQSNRIQGTNKKGRNNLYLMSKDGSSQVVLPTGLWESYTPQWSKQLPY